MTIEKILYTATASATGGREGQATSSDNALNVKLSTPRELGGAGGDGTNLSSCSPLAIQPAFWAP